ncbi:hypothetical protein QR685DRAFT_531198 [Neurospora intermedia]|uniref:BZIP domain-containing protein n=1 Tax=Neurospora intermedia TaxID=5142 RepID=A0ABR3D797_NEUIN
MSKTARKQSPTLEEKALPANQLHSQSSGNVNVSTKSETSDGDSTSSTCSSQQPAVSPSPSSTRNEVDEATQTSIVAEESDKPTTTSGTLPNPKTSQNAQSGSLAGNIEKFSLRHFPVLRKELNRKIEERRLVNQRIRNSLARIEHCEKYMRTLKTMEEELEAERRTRFELMALFRKAEQRFIASTDDWEGMVRDHLGLRTRIVNPTD